MPTNFDRPLQTPIPEAAIQDMGKQPYEVEVQLVDEAGIPSDHAADEGGEAQGELPFEGNLAEQLDDQELLAIFNDVSQWFDSDLQGRTDWERAYTKGLELLGLKYEPRNTPWPNAAGAYHPVLTEAVIRFQAQTMLECFPASGPARPSIVGKPTPEKIKRSQRVSDEVNYHIVCKMPEYRAESEQMLFRLPLGGSAFKKVYKDPIKQRAVSMFVPAEDFVVPFGASELTTAERYSHSMKRSTNELKKFMKVGFYKEYTLTAPPPKTTNIDEKTARLTGTRPQLEFDDRHHVVEMHVDYLVPRYDGEDDIAKPYVITVLKDENKVLSIRRNWVEGDPTFTRNQFFVHYPYLPGLGFYGIGLIHLIGGLATSATSILRQLIDAGTLSNLPAGFKARGLRLKAEDQRPLQPGEFRDIDVPGNAIKDSLYPLPIKEPSAVLFQLLGNVVDEARRIGSVADLKITDLSSEAPVGTTLALLERSLKVMSGVQARIHAALRQELKLIFNIIGSLPGNYEYDQEDTETAQADRAKDFSSGVDIMPVSDPNASTMAQRVVQYQAAMEFAARSPEIYDLPKLHYQMLNVLDIEDAEDIVKMPEDIKMMDPVSENMAILTMKPVRAFLQQDHAAHMAVHLNMAQDPGVLQMVGQAPNAAAIQSAMAAHIAEHLAFQYRTDIEKLTGTPLPPPGEPLPDDVEANLSRLVAQASGKLLAQSKAAVARAKAEEAMQDPMVQIELAKLKNATDEVQRKKAKDAIDVILRGREMLGREKLETARIAADLIAQEGQIRADQIQAGRDAAVQLTGEAIKANTAVKVAKERKPPAKPKPKAA